MKASILFIAYMLYFSCVAYAENMEVVYQTISMEAASEPIEGQVMVARVIINRARASNRSLEAICKAPKQFSAWNDPKWAKRWLSRHYDGATRLRAIQAYQRARNASQRYEGVRHYHVKGLSPRWASGHIPLIQIGSHLFYEGIR